MAVFGQYTLAESGSSYFSINLRREYAHVYSAKPTICIGVSSRSLGEHTPRALFATHCEWLLSLQNNHVYHDSAVSHWNVFADTLQPGLDTLGVYCDLKSNLMWFDRDGDPQTLSPPGGVYVPNLADCRPCAVMVDARSISFVSQFELEAPEPPVNKAAPPAAAAASAKCEISEVD